MLFFSGINIGFYSPVFTNPNNLIWFTSCFDYVQRNSSDPSSRQADLSREKNILNNDNVYDKSAENNLSAHAITSLDFVTSAYDTLGDKNSNAAFPSDSVNISGFDSSFAAADSVAAVDSMAIDSTARVENFKYKREDQPYTEIRTKKTPGFYAKINPAFKTKTIELDSTGKFVEIKEMVAGKPAKIILRLPIDEYIKLRLEARERELWENQAYKYERKQDTKGLGELIKDITDFEIPLPSVGVLSIFGPPKISLKIGGAVDIHGAWRNETTEGITVSGLGNTRNEPDFKQEVQINVNGTIGDKLQISADWNTQRNFEYENQLKIKYTGYEDEIIQSIEAGNVSLQTSPLVGGSEALFGVKANFKLGPLTLTTIASQKKGEITEVSINSGATQREFSVRAYEYSKNNYFLDKVYADTSAEFNLFYNYYASPTPQVNNDYTVLDIEVWKTIITSIRSPNERNANAFIDLPMRTPGSPPYPDSLRKENIDVVPGRVETGRFIKLEQGTDYELHKETGYITLKTNLLESDVLAVAYKFGNNNVYGELITEAGADTSKKLILKLIKPSNLRPESKDAWNLLLKNIYPIGGREINQDKFELDIFYQQEGQEPLNNIGGIRLLQTFELDKYGQNQNPNPDGLFDWQPGITINTKSGEIIFPKLQPFGRSLPLNLPDSLRYQAVYDTLTSIAQQDRVKDKWVIKGKYSAAASSVYPLSFNIVENSVRVTLNNRELTPGVDYVVDYNLGQLTLRNEEALNPGADLKISYEQNTLFQVASKTLLGMRGLFDFSKKTKLGFSILNLNEQTLSDKVRIGEEPLSNTIMGVDFNTSADLPFITNLLDDVISTREMSSFSLRGEAAYMLPDPNTKKSEIESDKGRSIAYIDDFEGAKKIIPVGINYGGWKDLSVPLGLRNISGLPKLEQMNYKAKSFWFNVLPAEVSSKEIWPKRETAPEDDRITVLDFIYLPAAKGTYNKNPILDDMSITWGGMMRGLSQTASNLIESNTEFIELWMKVDRAPLDAKIYIDLGRISEDVIPNDSLNTEDKNFNDLIDQGEDLGLDGLNDDQERIAYGNNLPDPAGDNYSYQASTPRSVFDYFNINGTQGNAASIDIGRFPDTEDIIRNNQVDLINSYFRYEIPLNPDPAVNRFIAGGGNAGWYLFRIPLKDTLAQFGSPSFSVVEMIRLFVNGVDDTMRIRIAEFNLVGNDWRKAKVEDSVLSISVVNIEDNPDYAEESKYLVPRSKNRQRADLDLLLNEQSLALILKDLQDGDSREAIKYLTRPLDVFNYKEMKLFIHGDRDSSLNSLSYSINGSYAAEVFFRFGGDSNNYYEYRKPVTPGWGEMAIPFSEMTALKQTRDSANVVAKIPVPGMPGHYYSVKGNPTLTSIKFLSVGIYNTLNEELIGPISGNLWVNELRVIGADDSPGWAYSVSTSLKLADLLTVNLNMSKTDPYFHRLSDRFGSRTESRNWGFSADLDVLKLVPINFNDSNLRLNYSHTESISKPLYLPGTDIRVSEAAELQKTSDIEKGFTPEEAESRATELVNNSQTLSVSDSWAMQNIRLKIPTSAWYIRDTFNGLSFGFNYNKTYQRSPTVIFNKSWLWNANMSYSLSLSQDYYFYPADIPVIGSVLSLFTDYRNVKIYFTPQNFNAKLLAKRNRISSLARQSGITDLKVAVSRDFTTSRGFGFNWRMTDGGFLNLSMNYSVDVNASLTHLEVDKNEKQRSESEIWKDIFTGSFFGRDNLYQQNFDLKTNPRLPSLWDLNKFFSLNMGYASSYQWNFDFRQEEFGRSAGFSSKATIGMTLRLKALTDPLFAEKPEEAKPVIQQSTASRGRGRELDEKARRTQEELQKELNIEERSDTTQAIDSLKVEEPPIEEEVLPKTPVWEKALLFLKTVTRTLFFDYESINVNFSNDNSFSANGIKGKGTGFGNFWGIAYNEDNGPSRSFMLGLSRSIGSRAGGTNITLTDNFSQRNNLDFRTSRPLWEGAKIDLNWKVGWSMNKSLTFRSDTLGNFLSGYVNSTGSIDRSFLSVPPVFFLSVFKSGITRVNELNQLGGNTKESLSQAFIDGFESLPLLSRLGFLSEFAKYIPRPNWRITWDGLEKIFIFEKIAKRVSFDHAYSSSYTEGWKINTDGMKEIQTQKIGYSFTPLAGLNFTFDALWGGNLTASVKYSTRANYDLSSSTKNIQESFSRDIGISASYSKSGFEVPLFGIALKNDIEFTFSYSNIRNSVVIYNMSDFNETGTPQDGTTRTTIEPRIKYVMSSKVTLSIFYRNISVEPEGASRVPPTTTNEMGLDVHISIQ